MRVVLLKCLLILGQWTNVRIENSETENLSCVRSFQQN